MYDSTSNSKASTSAPKPSARRPIHSFGSKTNHNRVDMVRYGMDEDKDIDEVDNAFSKPSRMSTPETVRRKSLTQFLSNEFCSDDNVLSQSLPASFLSSHYSDSTGEESSRDTMKLIHNKSSSTTLDSTGNRTRQMSQSPSNSYALERSQSFKFNPQLVQRDYSSKDSNGFGFATIVAIIGIICVVCFSVLYNNNTINMNNVYYDQIKFSNDIQILGEEFNLSNNSILQVQSGIETIFENEDTGSFTFVYNSKSSEFNKFQFENFINDVASTASKFLRNDSRGVSHIVLENSDLRMNTYSELINKYREPVERTGVMLVKELENLPTNLAMAFHYYCDEYNPLVKKSAILFTLDLGKCSDYYGEATSHAAVEKCLKSKWHSVPPDNIGPLLTRVMASAGITPYGLITRNEYRGVTVPSAECLIHMNILTSALAEQSGERVIRSERTFIRAERDEQIEVKEVLQHISTERIDRAEEIVSISFSASSFLALLYATVANASASVESTASPALNLGRQPNSPWIYSRFRRF